MKRIVLISLWIALAVLAPIRGQAKSEQEYQEEIAALQQRNARLESTVEMLQQQMDEMTSEAEANAREVQETRAAMKEVKDQIKALLAQQGGDDKEVQKKLEEQLENAVQRARDLEKELEDAREELEKRADTIEQLQKKQSSAKVKDLQAELEDAQADVQKLRKQFKSTLQLLQDREVELQSARQTIQALEDSDKADQRVVELEAMLADLNAKLIKLAQENAQLETRIEQQAGQLQDASQADEVAELRGELRNADELLNVYAADIKTLKAEKASLEEQLRQAAEQIGAQAEELAELKQTKADLERQLSQRAGEVEELRTTTEQIEAQAEELAELKQVNADLERQLSQRAGEVEELRTTAEQIEAQAEELAKLKQVNADLERQLSQRAGELETRDEAMTRLQEQNQQLQEQLADLDRQNSELQERVASLRQELQEQGSVPEAAKQRIEELTEELQDVKAQLDTQQRLQREYPKLQREAEACQERLAELSRQQEQCQTVRTQLQEVRQELTRVRSELDAVSTRNLELKQEQEDAATLRQRNAELEQQYAEGRRELELKEQLLQQVLTEKALLEKKFDEESTPYKTLQLQIEQAQARNATLQEQVNELRKMRFPVGGADAPGVSSALQEQLQEERARRRQAEADLLEARRKARTFQQQVAALNAQLMEQPGDAAPLPPLPVDASDTTLSAAIAALFPDEIARQTTDGTLNVLGWSPDRRKIAYRVVRPQQGEQLWILNTRTQQATQLAEGLAAAEAAVVRFAWASDSEHFLYAAGTPNDLSLYLGNSNGLIGQPLPLDKNGAHFAWSPTRLQFAYFSGANLVVRDVQGETMPLQLGHTSAADGTALQWSPDGAKIAFSAKRNETFDIFLLLFSESQPLLQTLVASPSDDIQPSWSPDGQQIAFYVRAAGYDTKMAVIPADRSRAPYIVAHHTVRLPFTGPAWLNPTDLLYVSEQEAPAAPTAIYTVNIRTGRRATAPLSVMLGN